MNSQDKPLTVATFYKFVNLADTIHLRNILLKTCRKRKIKGTIILASEGINATIAGSRNSIDHILVLLKEDERFADLVHREYKTREIPFHRLKVKIKKEIVTMGQPDIDPNLKTGKHVNAATWNTLLSDPDVLVIDARNHYEYKAGTFSNALSPETESFREFPAYVKASLNPEKHRKIAMFCTGGIRCEKAASYLLDQGFNEVYHLEGGILKYLEDVAPEENQWQGECFVFDGRIALDRDLEKGKHVMCYSCRMPLSVEDQQSAKYEEGISCPYCYDKLTEDRRNRLLERHRQVKLAEARNDIHIGKAIVSSIPRE